MAPRAAIIGGGVVGLSCAWRLASEGLSVTVIDRSPGKGASWAAAGMLAPASELTYVDSPHLAFNMAALREWESFAPELEEQTGARIGFVRSGTLMVALTPDDLAYLGQLAELHGQLGLKSEILTGEGARSIEPHLSPFIVGGLFSASDAQVENRRLIRALIRACQSRNVQFLADRVLAVVAKEDSIRSLELEKQGRFSDFDFVVLAAGAHSTSIEGLKELPPVHPVKGQILRVSQSPFAPKQVVRALARLKPVYAVPRLSEVVVGATMEDRGFDTTVTVGGIYEILREATQVLPGLDEAEVMEATARLRPATPDNLPYIGKGPFQNLVLAYGHFRNGVLQAPLTAKLVSDTIAEREVPAFASLVSPSRSAIK